MPVTDRIPHHQLQLSVEEYRSTVHTPFISEENQDMAVNTQRFSHDQLERSMENRQ